MASDCDHIHHSSEELPLSVLCLNDDPRHPSVQRVNTSADPLARPSDQSSYSSSSTVTRTTTTTTTTYPYAVDEADVSTCFQPQLSHIQPHNHAVCCCLRNFVCMSVLFSANHGCVVSCLALATARLGSDLGAWQSGILYLCYAGSAVFLGVPSMVARLGSRTTLMLGMGAYVAYVACFWSVVAARWSINNNNDNNDQGAVEWVAVVLGAMMGGVGAGILWTAQGSYFVQAAKDYSGEQQRSWMMIVSTADHDHHRADMSTDTAAVTSNCITADDAVSVCCHDDDVHSTSKLASVFAAIYLTEEVALRCLSTLLVKLGYSWSTVFACYSVVALVATVLMVFVRDYDTDDTTTKCQGQRRQRRRRSRSGAREDTYDAVTVFSIAQSSTTLPSTTPTEQRQRKRNSTLGLFWNDPRMKYMMGLNIVFGWAAAFINSYVNGQVLPMALDSDAFIGLYTSWDSVVAAGGSIVFGKVSSSHGYLSKSTILMLGSLCFGCVALPFLFRSEAAQWKSGDGLCLLFVYSLHGIGRATFEGTLKAVFADTFGYENKEAAFSNIVFQNGLASFVGYVLTTSIRCNDPSKYYCVRYTDGSLHNLFIIELLILASSILTIIGLRIASGMAQPLQVGTPPQIEPLPLAIINRDI